MSSYSINVPESNRIDALAEQRELRDQRVRARMSRKAYIDTILAGVRDAMEERGNPLAELADTLFDAPVRDQFDFRGFVGMRDGHRLGKTVLALVAQASLDSYQDADVEGF